MQIRGPFMLIFSLNSNRNAEVRLENIRGNASVFIVCLDMPTKASEFLDRTSIHHIFVVRTFWVFD